MKKGVPAKSAEDACTVDKVGIDLVKRYWIALAEHRVQP